MGTFRWPPAGTSRWPLTAIENIVVAEIGSDTGDDPADRPPRAAQQSAGRRYRHLNRAPRGDLLKRQRCVGRRVEPTAPQPRQHRAQRSEHVGPGQRRRPVSVRNLALASGARPAGRSWGTGPRSADTATGGESWGVIGSGARRRPTQRLRLGRSSRQRPTPAPIPSETARRLLLLVFSGFSTREPRKEAACRRSGHQVSPHQRQESVIFPAGWPGTDTRPLGAAPRSPARAAATACATHGSPRAPPRSHPA